MGTRIKKYIETHEESLQNIQYLLLSIVAFLIILDVILVSNEDKGDTISEIVQTNTDNGLYAIVWIWGFLASHLFMIRKRRWIHELLGLGIILAIAILIYFKHSDIVSFFADTKPESGTKLEKVKLEVYLIYVSLGVILGYIFWPQVKNE